MKLLEENKKSFSILKEYLEKNNPIIVPTDTNYNLCCLPNDNKAIDKIFEYKNRKKDKPLSLFFAKPDEWKLYGETQNEELMELLVENFWPGALNIILENKTMYGYAINHSKTIALGCVSNSVMRNFITFLKSPVTITSANISGTADDLLVTEEVAKEHMGDKVEYLLKSNKSSNNTKSSTIVQIKNNSIKIIREGDLAVDTIKKVIVEKGYEIEY